MAKVRRGIDPSKPEMTVYPAEFKGKITLAAFSEIWLPRHDVTHNVRSEIAALLRDIDKLDNPATTARVKAVLRAMFQAAAPREFPDRRGTRSAPEFFHAAVAETNARCRLGIGLADSADDLDDEEG
jgi:hypothetical protein